MLGIRIEPELERELERLAKHTGRSKSEVARDAIRRYVQAHNFSTEARAQSLRASARDSAGDLLAFDDRGWTP